MTYLAGTFTDNDRNGFFDSIENRYVNEDYFGRVSNELTVRDNEWDGVTDQKATIWNSYNDLGQLIQTYTGYDYDHAINPGYEAHSWNSYVFDSGGKLVTERQESADYDLDGYPDYSTIANSTYNAAGSVALEETIYKFNNDIDPYNYRTEEYTYNSKGLLSELRIDDTGTLDFEIAFQYTYNSRNQLTKVTEMDPFDYGDENFHVAETYRYSGARLTESNQYAEFFSYTDSAIEGSHVLEVKTQFSYDASGRVASELKIGAAYQTWNTVEKQQTDHVYDANGREIDTWIYADNDVNGVWDTDSTVHIQMAYDEAGDMNYRAIDFNYGDGEIESLYTVVPYTDYFA